MQLDFPSRTRKRVSLTSLIDVIFLLLLFFMLSSTFSKYSEIEVFSAKSGGGSSNAKPDIFMKLTSNELKLNGQTVQLENIPSAIKSIASKDEIKVILKVEDQVTSQHLMDIVEKLTMSKINVTVIR